MARSVVESILVGKESGLRAGERVQRQFERMVLAQQEAERYREQREMEGAERVFKFGLSQLEDVAWNILTPDEQKAPVIGTTQAAAKRMGIEWAFADPVPQAMLADFQKIGIDPAMRAWPEEQAEDYMERTYRRYWQAFLNETENVAKVSGLVEAEEAKAAKLREDYERKQLEPGKKMEAELPSVPGPLAPEVTEFQPLLKMPPPIQLGPTAEGTAQIEPPPEAPRYVPLTKKQLIAQALFGPTRDELPMEDAMKVAAMMKNPEVIPGMVPLLMLSDDGRKSVRNMAIYEAGIPQDEWDTDPGAGATRVVRYYQNKAERRRQEKNQLVMMRALPNFMSQMSLTRTPEERQAVVNMIWTQLPQHEYIDPNTGESITYSGTEEAFKTGMMALAPWTFAQEMAAEGRANKLAQQGLQLGLRTANDWIKWLADRGIGPENPVYAELERILGMSISRIGSPPGKPGIPPAPVVEITETGTSGLRVLPLPEPGMFGPETFPRLGEVPGQTVTQQRTSDTAEAREKRLQKKAGAGGKGAGSGRFGAGGFEIDEVAWLSKVNSDERQRYGQFFSGYAIDYAPNSVKQAWARQAQKNNVYFDRGGNVWIVKPEAQKEFDAIGRREMKERGITPPKKKPVAKKRAGLSEGAKVHLKNVAERAAKERASIKGMDLAGVKNFLKAYNLGYSPEATLAALKEMGLI